MCYYLAAAYICFNFRYVLSLLPAAFCLVYIALAFYVYESPKFLASNHKRDDLALKSLAFYNEPGKQTNKLFSGLR